VCPTLGPDRGPGHRWETSKRVRARARVGERISNATPNGRLPARSELAKEWIARGAQWIVDPPPIADCDKRVWSTIVCYEKKGVLWTEYRFKSENVSPLLKRSRKKLGKRGGFGGMAERQEMHRSESAACVACFAECAPLQNPSSESSRTFPSPHQFLHRCPQLQWSFVA